MSFLSEKGYTTMAAAGIDNPTQFERKHIVHKDKFGRVSPIEDILHAPKRAQPQKEN